MFKTKEELKEEHWNENRYPPNCTSYDEGVNDAFKSFAERVEFYKKYYNNRDKFCQDYPDEWDIKIEFDWWLFSYCFGDIKWTI